MAGVITSTNTNDNALMIFLQRRLLATLLPTSQLYQLAEKFPIPKGSGVQMTMTAWRRIAAASSTLNQSASNEPVALSSRRVNVTISQYGRHVQVSDLAENTTISSPTQGAIQMVMESLAVTIDNVLQLAVFKNDILQVGVDGSNVKKILSAFFSAQASALCANTGTHANSLKFGYPVVFAQSAARLSAVSRTAPSISARFGPIGVRKAVSRLQRLNAQPYADGLYYGVIHPLAVATCQSNSDWKQWHVNYSEGPKESMFKGRVGPSIHGVKFLVSSNIPRAVQAGTGDPHSCNLTPIFGKGALGAVELDGGSEVIIKRSAASSTNDPYDLIAATVAFKAKMVGAVLNPSAGCILISHEAV